jgi:hypothetical protein
MEVQKALFKVKSYALYHIFYILTNRKLDLREAEKAVSRVRLTLFIHILHYKQPKLRVGRGRENKVSSVPQTLQSIFLRQWSL